MPTDSRAIRIIHVGPSIKARGGMASVIANFLSEQRRDPDLSVTAVATTQCRGRSSPGDILMFAAAFFHIMFACLARPKPILHVHLASRGAAIRKGIVVRLARLLGAPCLGHDHSTQSLFRKSGRFMKSWKIGTLRRLNALITLSDWDRRFLQSLVNLPVQVVPNGVAIPGQIRRPPASPDKRVSFLFLGGDMRRKGVFPLLEAFAILRKGGLPARLTIVGNHEAQEVREWVREHDLEKDVDVPGWLEGKAKAELLANAHVFVLASFREGVPVAMLEAMAFGLPVVATTVGGIPEVVVAGETGLLLEPGDVAGLAEAMKRLATDAQLRRRMGEAGRKVIEQKYSLEAVCVPVKKLYLELAGRQGSLGSSNGRQDR